MNVDFGKMLGAVSTVGLPRAAQISVVAVAIVSTSISGLECTTYDFIMLFSLLAVTEL